jgi:hypothetical protein
MAVWFIALWTLPIDVGFFNTSGSGVEEDERIAERRRKLVLTRLGALSALGLAG